MTEEDNEQDNQTENIDEQAEEHVLETEQIQNVIEVDPVQPSTEEREEAVEGDEEQDDNEEDKKGAEEIEGDLADEEIIEAVEELDPAELEALFNKNTSSFRCLAQILLSRSSLLRHPLYNFPPLEDPGIDAAFNYVEPEEPIDTVCIERYKKLCKEMNIVPISRVIKSLPTKQLNLKYYSLTANEVKAVAIALKLNTYVEELDLEENFLYPESACYIEELLRENNTLKVLNMRECRIGPEGAANLSEGIMLTQSLHELDLSFNDLGTAGLKALASAFKENGTIKKLNLSHNNLSLDAAYQLASILKENFVFEDLDLSWNNFGSPQAMKVLFNEGITVNGLIRSLNLAWNGIVLKTAIKPLIKFIKKTDKLEILDLNNNRIGGVTLNMIKNAVKKNTSLRALSLAYNVLTPDNAQAMADVLTSPKAPPNLEVLDMENVFVKKEFIPTLKKADKMGKIIKVTGILGNWKIKGPNVGKLLFDRARLLAMKPKRKKMKKDFSHFVLALPDKPMKKGNFETAVKMFKMKLVDNDLMAEIMKLFPYKKKGIDCAGMKEKYMKLFPDAQPAPPKKKKKGKGKGKNKKKGGDRGPSITNIKAGSQFTISTAGGSSIFSSVSDKKTQSVSDATHSSALFESSLNVKPPSRDDTERSKSLTEGKRLSFVPERTSSPGEGKRLSESKRTSVTFSDTKYKTEEGLGDTAVPDDRNTDGNIGNEDEDSQPHVSDSRHSITKTQSQESMKYSEASRDSSQRSAAFSINLEEQAKASQEPLPTIVETLEIAPDEIV